MSKKTGGVDRLTDILKGFGVLILVLMSFYVLQILIVWIFNIAGASLSPAAERIICPAVWILGAVLVSVIWRKSFFEEYRIFSGGDKKQFWLWPVYAILAFCMGVALNFTVGFLVDVIPFIPEAWLEANSEAVSSVSKGSPLAVFAALYIMVPLAEELVFRGRGYKALQESCGGIVAAVVTSLLFAVFHGNILQGIYAFVAGLIFALIIEKSGSLLTGIFAHAGFNIAGALGVAFLAKIDETYKIIGAFVVLLVTLTGILLAGGIFERAEEQEDDEDGEFDGYDSVD